MREARFVRKQFAKIKKSKKAKNRFFQSAKKNSERSELSPKFSALASYSLEIQLACFATFGFASM